MDPSTTVTFVGNLLKEAQKQGLIDRLIAAFKQKPRILLLGCTGAGKTNFLKSLTTANVAAISREDRTFYTEAKNLVIQKTPYRFIDTTGDVARADDRNQAIREAMAARGGVAGIINVVSYGYHEYGIERKHAVTATAEADTKYLELHRTEEIKQLHEWSALLGDPVTCGWLMTVVTKADLWWSKNEEVLSYYKSGEYFAALDKAQRLNQRVLPYSSVFHKFFGEVPMSGSFDQENHDLARNNLLNALIAALLKKQGA